MCSAIPTFINVLACDDKLWSKSFSALKKADISVLTFHTIIKAF